MRLRLALVFICGFVATAAVAQQPRSPFATTPVTQPTAGQTTTPANQGVATNPTGDANTAAQPGVTTTEPAAGPGGIATNSTGGSAFGLGSTNRAGGTAPLFLNVTPTTITDASGSPIGVLQQLSLNPSGSVNFGIVNMGGRLVPVPWQLIVSGTGGTRGSLAVNADSSLLQRAPPVLMGQLPMLTQDEVQAQILNHFGLQPTTMTQPAVVATGTARGGTGGAGVTITGGSTNTAAFGTAAFSNNITANSNAFSNSTRSNQAVNTTGGLLSPTGRTNGIYDGFNSGPGSTDRFGPRQNGNAAQPPPTQPAQSTQPTPAPPPPTPTPAPTPRQQ
ncbi:MAG TPA: hypothetical protein VJ063_15345 [Verrucomicrobiae bacterium]|nr:hypothetical protein [Verrucomicrobiae bacterium]